MRGTLRFRVDSALGVVADGAPDALRGGGHWHIRDAEWGEASRIALITVGVEATVPPSPTPLARSGFVKAATEY